MRKQILFLIMIQLIIINNIIFSQSNVTAKFEYGYFNSNEFSFPYRLFVPQNYDSTQMYPIVLTLHGAGESGTDNEIQIEVNHLATCWAESLFQLRHPSFIVSPQSTGGWEFHSVIHMLDSLIDVYNIDTNRIYITGLSMGGYGTWWYMDNYPDYFAAAVPVCGGWSNYENRIEAISHIPIWNHHGEKDNVVPTDLSRNIFNAYSNISLPIVYPDRQKYVKRKISAETKQHILTDNIDYIYSEHKNVDHFAWNSAYADSMVLEWLFSKRKRANNLIGFSNDDDYLEMDSTYMFKINSMADTLEMVLSYSSNLGYTWTEITRTSSHNDSILINTSQLDDSPLGQFRLQVIDNEEDIIGADYSGYYKIDNQDNFIPWLNYYTSNRSLSLIDDSHIDFFFNVNDVENDSLLLSIYYKHDDSSVYDLIQTEKLEVVNMDQVVSVYFDDLLYGEKARLKFELTDGDNTVIDSTAKFRNNNNKPEEVNIISFNNQNFRVYPNPTKNHLNVETNSKFDSNIEYELIDINGRIILENEMHSNMNQIELFGLKAGIYFLKLYNQSKFLGIKKIIIK
ncbi:T9SS type A sorting domain-containing protein [Bacteroidota bacterium]